MSGEEITIEISADGSSVVVEGKAISGPECTKLTKEIESALGTVTRQQLKSEFYQSPAIKRKASA